jgi:hypothetical protein
LILRNLSKIDVVREPILILDTDTHSLLATAIDHYSNGQLSRGTVPRFDSGKSEKAMRGSHGWPARRRTFVNPADHLIEQEIECDVRIHGSSRG